MIDPAVLRDFDAGVDAVVPTWIPEEGAPYSVTAVDVLFDNEILGDRMVYASAKWPNGQMAKWPKGRVAGCSWTRAAVRPGARLAERSGPYGIRRKSRFANIHCWPV